MALLGLFVGGTLGLASLRGEGGSTEVVDWVVKLTIRKCY